MEFNIIGIGTKFYGKKDRQASSWTATLWIVFLYLPVIPLGTSRVYESMSFGRGMRLVPRDKLGFDFKQIFVTWLVSLAALILIALAATVFIFLVRNWR